MQHLHCLKTFQVIVDLFRLPVQPPDGFLLVFSLWLPPPCVQAAALGLTLQGHVLAPSLLLQEAGGQPKALLSAHQDLALCQAPGAAPFGPGGAHLTSCRSCFSDW